MAVLDPEAVAASELDRVVLRAVGCVRVSRTNPTTPTAVSRYQPSLPLHRWKGPEIIANYKRLAAPVEIAIPRMQSSITS